MIYFPMPSFAETVERAARNMPAIRKYWIAPGAEIVEETYIQDDRWVQVRGSTIALASPLVITQLRFDRWMRRLDFQHCPDWRATDGRRV